MIIGLHGYAQSGKDAVGQVLVEHHGFKRLALADPLREALEALNPLVSYSLDPNKCTRYLSPVEGGRQGIGNLRPVLKHYGSWDELKKNPDVRRLLQRLGTEVGRNLWGERFWINQAWEKIAAAPGKWVITDVRFPNEAAWITDRNGWLFKVERPEVGPVNGHSSDAGIPEWKFDYIIDNNGTLEDLRHQVNEIVKEHPKFSEGQAR